MVIKGNFWIKSELLFFFVWANETERFFISSYTVRERRMDMYTSSVLKQGDIGISVNKMQAYLNVFQERGLIQTRNLQDGVYGTRTMQSVSEFQRFAGLPVDGVIGNNTWDAIVNKLRELGVITNFPVASNRFYLSSGDTGIGVFKMQEYLNEIAAANQCLRPIPVDGMFGPRTTTAVQMFQYLYDLTIDGVIGSKTWDAIVNERNSLGAAVPTPQPR